MSIVFLQLSFDTLAKYGGLYGGKNPALSTLQVRGNNLVPSNLEGGPTEVYSGHSNSFLGS